MGFNREHIAPCGINCGVCIAYLRKKNPCCGCNENSLSKPKHCISCRIKNCDHLLKTKSGFCFECSKFPCLRIRQLDARYVKNYQTSLIHNLQEIQKNGVTVFLILENKSWICLFCGQVLSVHSDVCLACNKPRNK